MKIEHAEQAIEHAASAIGSGLKALLHFLAANSGTMAKAAEIAEGATGNAELIPITEAVSKAVGAGATVLSNINMPGASS